MCGRYSLFTEEESADIHQILQEIDRKYGASGMKTGEVYPTNLAPVLLAENNAVSPELLTWGFPSFKGKGVIINARAETAPVKPMFKKSLNERRCVIPTTGFYEWDAQKHKYRFNLPGSGSLYLAGLYNEFKGEQRYVILTTAANDSIINVHDRMPVILRQDEVEPWVRDEAAAGEILRRVPPVLVHEQVS